MGEDCGRVKRPFHRSSRQCTAVFSFYVLPHDVLRPEELPQQEVSAVSGRLTGEFRLRGRAKPRALEGDARTLLN